ILAATRTIWQDPGEQTWMKGMIEKLHVLPKEQNLAYDKACASCHMLYAPSMLPARSWQVLMSGLSDHFGDNAEVSDEVRVDVSEYLQRNAADKVENIYAQPMLALLQDDKTPLRISETKYFTLLHDVVRPQMIASNPDVKSVARCEACHYEALQGRYNRFAVRIPNYYKEGIWRPMRAPATKGSE
ncbi:MAG TPA: hypothetical protein EYP39_03795, partial [Ghiorsea sp.]|nr:hypothetical protein [Ghiorsea sp.]